MATRPMRVNSPALDVARLREDFPILATTVHGNKPLVYLDNAASAQKPHAVLTALDYCYRQEYANVHRGLHVLSERVTARYEGTRRRVQQFLNARSHRELVFVRGTTEAINLVAASLVETGLSEWDEILITGMEHHSNIVPWQMACKRTGAKLRHVPIDTRGELVLEEYERLLGPRTRLVAVTHVSNALGTINPVKELTSMAHKHGVSVLIDGAQAVPHFRVDVQDLDCDFYAFSSHKLFGPTGVGVLYGRLDQLERVQPMQGGGDMISKVTLAHSEYNELPYRLEAGTPHIAGVIGLGAAVEYIESLDAEAVARHERALLEHATARLEEIPGLRVIGTARDKCALVSFVFDDIHAHDIGTVLDAEGVAVRSGHHCSMPVMDFFDVPATTRAAFVFYNTHEEIERLAETVVQARDLLGGNADRPARHSTR